MDTLDACPDTPVDDKKLLKRIAVGAVLLGTAITASGLAAGNALEDMLADARDPAPFVHVGVTARTAMQQVPVRPYVDFLANMQFYINDGRNTERPLEVLFHIADNNISEITLTDDGEVVYRTELEDITGIIHARIRYDAEHSGTHHFVLEAEDASGNTTTARFTTEGNEIVSSRLPADDQAPVISFAYKDDAWRERIEGDGYQGTVFLSDRTPYLLGDGVEALPLRPVQWAFSAHVFDEDIYSLRAEMDGQLIFTRTFEEGEYDGRHIREPAEVHTLYFLPRGGGTATVRVTATDRQGRTSVEEREVSIPYSAGQ